MHGHKCSKKGCFWVAFSAKQVYVQVETGKFAQRAVTLGSQNGDQLEILGGLKETDRVVAQGSLFLQFANSAG